LLDAGKLPEAQRRCIGRFKLTLEWPEAPAFFLVILTSSSEAHHDLIDVYCSGNSAELPRPGGG
jgi:hypothetical protein